MLANFSKDFYGLKFNLKKKLVVVPLEAPSLHEWPAQLALPHPHHLLCLLWIYSPV